MLAAARAAGATRIYAQSIAWKLRGDRGVAVAEHERAVLDAGGGVIRYGQLYGPGTYFEKERPDPPRIRVDEAARRTLPILGRAPRPRLLTQFAKDRCFGRPPMGKPEIRPLAASVTEQPREHGSVCARGVSPGGRHGWPLRCGPRAAGRPPAPVVASAGIESGGSADARRPPYP